MNTALKIAVTATVLMWAGIVNGLPFFFPDTSNYIRAPDALVIKVLGPQFSSSWTLSDADLAARSGTGVNMVEEGTVLAGRSPYYGLIPYLGEITHLHWLPVVIQASALAYVFFVLAFKCFNLDCPKFLVAVVLTATLSSASFFASFLMPDVFAGIAILIIAIFLSSWDALSRTEKILLSLILTFALLSHTTIIMISTIIAAIVATAFGVLYLRRMQVVRVAPLLTVIGCVALGLLGEAGFYAGVTKLTGFPPIRPPFVTARLIELGPGLNYLKANCDHAPFAICKYLNRLPQPTDTFLWDRTPETGVFMITEPAMKRKLGDEQAAFAFSVLKFDPIGLGEAVAKASISQLCSFGLLDFMGHWPNERLPPAYRELMSNTTATKHPQFIEWSAFIQRLAVVASAAYLLMVFISTRNKKTTSPGNTLSEFDRLLIIVFIGVLANAWICATFSSINDRYQARVMWLIPLLAIVHYVARFSVSKKPSADSSARS